MTDYYVGPGGNDSNDGLTWGERKLTLNGAEDVPVVAGDNVYVGPGTYKETLTVDVSGSSGNPITYIGDIAGANTDMIGGAVVITGANDEVTVVRTEGIIWGANANYRTFRGLHVYRTDYSIYCDISSYTITDLIVEDCVLYGEFSFYIPSNSSANIPDFIFRRSILSGFFIKSTVDRDTVDALVENCIFIKNQPVNLQALVDIQGYYNVTFNNCTFGAYPWLGTTRCSVIVDMVSTSNAVYFYNSVFEPGRLRADGGLGVLVEDYNNIARGTASTHTNVTVGSNTTSYVNYFQTPLLGAPEGIAYKFEEYTFSAVSGVPPLACNSNAATEDLFGITRPSAVAKRTRGAIEYNVLERETTTVYGSSPESFMMRDAMAVQFIVPITGKKMRLEAQVYREADYSGTLPQATIKQYGQSDIVLTDTGSAETWNEFKESFTPADFPLFVALELRSSNGATSGDYKVFWDALKVT